MSEHADFEETQGLPLWIKAIVVLPVVAIAIPAVAAWADGAVGGGLVLTALALVFAVMALPAFVVRLVTRVASGTLELRIEPLGMPVPFMPPRVNTIAAGDIERCEARGYRAFSDREFWGPHFWGLGTSSRGDAHLYLMNGRPFSAPAVRLEIAGGEKVLVGSARPDELVAAIERAKSE